MRVLITGGTGFVGSHMVAAWVKQKHDVRLLVSSHTRVEPALTPLENPVCGVVTGDVTDEEPVVAAVS
jgi:uncharacterized protein YbjT (DUF2867 family)